MSEKEIKLFVIFLQKLNDKIGTERLDRLFGYTIGTFYKLYDKEEERDCIIEDITKYIDGEAKYIDDGYEEDDRYEEERRNRQKEVDDIMNKIGTVIKFFTK